MGEIFLVSRGEQAVHLPMRQFVSIINQAEENNNVKQ